MKNFISIYKSEYHVSGDIYNNCITVFFLDTCFVVYFSGMKFKTFIIKY